MSDNNKSYRIRTKIGVTETSAIADKYLTVSLNNEIDSIEIMSLKIKQENVYKLHGADYGVVVGRAIANGGFGVPNVKVSVFIPASQATKNDAIYNAIYPYERVTQKNSDNIRYNLLPDVGNDDCYQVVGTFPNKRLVLDDDNYLEIYDTYYKFTTRTNNAGDYMIFGIPTGGQILHFDTDLSDVGILSQKPRDMIFKGYNINQFENPNQFKADDNLANLPQIISQDESVYVYPFWGDEDENIIGITRHDIDINYKFEPTCVFIGSIVSDTNSDHISKKCIPTPGMGVMEDLITGPGTIEMIRKKQNGDIEQFNVQGTQLIDENGRWCYQIPMNLDYTMTDEYGNLVPSNDPTKGIATRAKVRFRISMDEFQNDTLNSFRTKVLVPNNPLNEAGNPDYVFGSFTEDESFRDLLWNNVYTVKSFIPRFQKGNGESNRRFSGIKQCNYHGQNNPIPYNNMRINLSFQFVITCLIVKLLIMLIGVYNAVMTWMSNMFGKFPNLPVIRNIKRTAAQIDRWSSFWKTALHVLTAGTLLPLHALGEVALLFERIAKSLSCIYIDGSMCEQLEGSWYFAPNCGKKGNLTNEPFNYLWLNMFAKIEGKKNDRLDYSSKNSRSGGGQEDKSSIDDTNADGIGDEDSRTTIEGSRKTETYDYVIARGINYFLQCIEISLAQEYRVIQFDFYNDWINGMIYIPKWERSLKRKRKYFLFGKTSIEVRACNDNYTKRFFERKNRLTEQCAVSYKGKNNDNSIGTSVGCKSNKKYKCHKKRGRKQYQIFKNGGAVHSELTSSGMYAYYFKPCEIEYNRNTGIRKRINLFATDIVLLGSMTDCDLNGTPSFTNELTSTTYQLPSPLAHTDSQDEGFTYNGKSDTDTILRDETGRLVGAFDYGDTILNPGDDGSMTEESGIDWGYTGPGQGEPKKAKTYTPGGHFLGISCVNSESSIKSCVNLKRICEVNVWPSVRQEVFNGYDETKTGKYLDIIPNGLISKDEIAGGNFRKLFSTMNGNNLRTKVNDSGFTVYDFYYMSPENFGGDLYKYYRNNYNEVIELTGDSMSHYFAKSAEDVDEDGNKWGNSTSEADKLNITPIRRSLENRDADYMRFRLGLTGNTNAEIQSKYLGMDDYGFYMPVYNNSFYFYFGLKPGATALDEFHRQFFSECRHTISGTDTKILATFNYKKNPSDEKEVDAFEEGIELTIFDDKFNSVEHSSSLRIFTTAIPVKVMIDSDPSKVHIENSSVYQNKSYIDIDNRPNLFDFEVGRHTVTITDAEGRTTTKLIEVRRENVELCPKVDGYDFKDGDYIIEKTGNLISGTTQRSRESLGGWFSFNWNESVCGGNPSLFRYHSGGLLLTVSINDACIVFVGKSHIIKVGSWDDLSDYPEFSGYNAVFTGTGVTSTNGYHIYAGEEASYKMYVLYKNGNRETPYPILLDAEVYVGEPPEIDFDVFREVIENEEDSPVTFRNPIIKAWHDNKDYWYQHLYDCGELSYDQIWYVKKTMFFIFESAIPETDTYNDMDENYPSKRNLYLNTYYGSEVGNVVSTINESIGSVMENVMPGNEYKIKITGSTADGQSVKTPKDDYKFKLPIIYKPYYYKAVIWEGYSAFENTTIENFKGYAMGHAIGTIYNGITYDYMDGNTPKTAFGRTVLNEARDLTDIVNQDVAWMGDDEMTSGRTTSFRYDANETGETYSRFEGVESSLLITEGSPDIIESTYVPVEYSISTPGIGGPSSWEVFLELVDTGSGISNNISRTMRVVTYNEYDTLNGYVFTGFSDDMYTNVEPSGWTAITASESTDEYGDPTMEFSFSYSGSENVLMCESMKLDDLIYNSNIPESQLGYLKSRNIIRHGFNQDYKKRNNMGIVIQGTTIQSPSVRDVIEKMRINVGLDSNSQANKFWQNIEDIIVTWRNGSDYVTVKLLSELGYSIEYEDEDGNEKIVVDVTDVYVDEHDMKSASFIPEDAFTEKALSTGWLAWYADVTLVCGGIGSVVPPSGGRASANPGCNNTINRVTYEKKNCKFTYGPVD